MNTKFFDMNKSKQDRIINGSLKIFCRYGYRHASTDEIVAEAGISKGLLFHYFMSKKGLYRFLYDYCAHYMADELRRASVVPGEDFFEVEKKLTRVAAGIVRIYPCLPLFLVSADLESDPEAVEALSGLPLLGTVRQRAEEMTAQSSGRLPAEDLQQLAALLTNYRIGRMRDMLRRDISDPDALLTDCMAQISLLERLALS